MAQQKSQLTPEMLVPKLGDALVRGGHISEKDLEKALAYQQEQIAQHKTYLLGQALIDLNLIDRSTLDSALLSRSSSCARPCKPPIGTLNSVSKSGQQNCRRPCDA